MAIDIPGYKILRTLGRGGMATVFLAEQEIFEREVALKVMSKALAEDDSFGKRFFREAKIVSQLVHPHIVTVYDVGLHEGNYYLSMEYIDGSDLKQLRNDLTLRQKIRAVVDIAKALEYAGAKGYVHRDIKPENILFQKSDGRAVLTDFGIARAAETDTSMTQTGTAIGTPHYMSPEQAKGRPVDPRSDIYSLGIVFFQLLTGRVPFDAESAVAIGIKHITEPVPLLPEGMDALQPVIDTLLAKKPDNRYQTADEFIEHVQHVDIALLEQNIHYARQSIIDRADSERPTEKTQVTESTELGIVFDKDSELIDRPSILPWFIGLLIASSLAGWLLYHQKPEVVGPWMDGGKAFIIESYAQLKASLASEEKPGAEALVEAETRDENPRYARATPVPSTAPRKLAPEPAVALEPTPAPVLSPRPTAIPSAAPIREPEFSLVAYQEKISALESMYKSDGTYLADLVAMYRAAARDYPKEKSLTTPFTALKKRELAATEYLIAQGKVESARRKTKQLRALFPEVSAAQFTSLEKKIAREVKVQALLLEADRLMANYKLTEPKGANAKLRYQQVLQLQPNNKKALAGLASVVSKLVSSAQAELDRGKLEQAKIKANLALDIDEGNKVARAIRDKASTVLAHQQEMKRLFDRAESRLKREAYFSPQNDSAFHYYQKILQREPNSVQAITGQKMLVDGFARSIWSLVGSEQISQAKQELALAMRYMPENQRLKSLAQAVDEVVADKFN
ncbi:Serine/threonine protein kinase [Alteromonadaceae bacterium Bs31]|nr:Serine/threonine protein kinase [Alteromonadaceae bacterium Bs31]